jgi:hypothetical protein
MSAFDNNNVAQVTAGNVLVSVGGRQPSIQALQNKGVVQKAIRITGNTFFP